MRPPSTIRPMPTSTRPTPRSARHLPARHPWGDARPQAPTRRSAPQPQPRQTAPTAPRQPPTTPLPRSWRRRLRTAWRRCATTATLDAADQRPRRTSTLAPGRVALATHPARPSIIRCAPHGTKLREARALYGGRRRMRSAGAGSAWIRRLPGCTQPMAHRPRPHQCCGWLASRRHAATFSGVTVSASSIRVMMPVPEHTASGCGLVSTPPSFR